MGCILAPLRDWYADNAMSIHDGMEFVPPWVSVEPSVDEGLTLLSELERELAENEHHPLARFQREVLARRVDRDDILVATNNVDKPLAVVHLTWRKGRETDPRWPRTKFFASWIDWVNNEMLPAGGEREAKS